MPDTGAPWTIPYPAPTDPVDDPAQSQAMATRVAANLSSIDTSAGEFTPTRYGLLSWSYDLDFADNFVRPPVGRLVGERLLLGSPRLITAVVMQVGLAGSGLTAGANAVGVYNSSGALIGQTADQSVNWATAKAWDMNLVTPVTPPDAEVTVAFITNGSTAPGFAAPNTGANTALYNYGQPATGLRMLLSSGSGITTLPATLPALALGSTHFWIAVK